MRGGRWSGVGRRRSTPRRESIGINLLSCRVSYVAGIVCYLRGGIDNLEELFFLNIQPFHNRSYISPKHYQKDTEGSVIKSIN